MLSSDAVPNTAFGKVQQPNLKLSFIVPVLEGEMLIKFLWNHEVVTHPIKNVAVLQELNSNTHTHVY